MGRPSVCQCEISEAQTLWRTAPCRCFRKWSGEKWSGSRLAAGSGLKQALFPKEALIYLRNRQLLCFIYILAGLAGKNYRAHFGSQRGWRRGGPRCKWNQKDPSLNAFLRGEVRWPANMEIRAKSVAGHFKGSWREENAAKAWIPKNPSTAVASVMKQL